MTTATHTPTAPDWTNAATQEIAEHVGLHWLHGTTPAPGAYEELCTRTVWAREAFDLALDANADAAEELCAQGATVCETALGFLLC